MLGSTKISALLLTDLTFHTIPKIVQSRGFKNETRPRMIAHADSWPPSLTCRGKIARGWAQESGLSWPFSGDARSGGLGSNILEAGILEATQSLERSVSVAQNGSLQPEARLCNCLIGVYIWTSLGIFTVNVPQSSFSLAFIG